MDSAPGSLIGQPVDRAEDPRFLTATGHSIDDMQRRGILHAAVFRSGVRTDASAASIRLRRGRSRACGPCLLEAVQKSMRQIRSAIGATTINPNLLTAAERIQYEGYLRREEANAAILGLAKEGIAIKEIVRCSGHSRGLVRAVLRGRRSGGGAPAHSPISSQ
jgi:transposase